MNPPARPSILSLDRVTAGRGHVVLERVDWRLREGELWAVAGPNGAGKSSLLGVLRGRIPIRNGALRYGPGRRGRALAADPVGQVLPVAFDAQTVLLRGAAGYAQSRWHAGQDEAVARVRDVLGAALALPEGRRIVDALALDDVLDRRVSELSNGERRKLALARAAMRRPAVLALDNPFNGLDARARRSVSEAVGRLHQDGSMAVLVTTSRAEELFEAVTHVLLLDRGRVVASGPRDGVVADARFARLVGPEPRAADRAPRPAPASLRASSAGGAPVVELRGVDLTYGRTRVLSGVHWTVHRGERWAVIGPNGAGKSALLSLILADNPQAYANDVTLFGRRRGSGDTIWEIRRRIGSVSPETHLYHGDDRGVLDVIAAGLRDGPASPRRPTAHELEVAERWAAALGLEHCRDRRFGELSEGERQTALLGRALAKEPELLVLDEPCQGLDASRRARFLGLLEGRLLATDTTLIYVTHDLEEVPSAVGHGLLLRRGRSAREGSAEEVMSAYSAG